MISFFESYLSNKKLKNRFTPCRTAERTRKYYDKTLGGCQITKLRFLILEGENSGYEMTTSRGIEYNIILIVVTVGVLQQEQEQNGEH